MMGSIKRMRRVQSVRIVNENGKVLHFPALTTVEDLLRSYPRHFVCGPDLSNCSENLSNHMLSSDTELQTGHIYCLLPLSRSVDHGAQSPASQCQRHTDIDFVAPAEFEEPEKSSSEDHRPKPHKLQLKIRSCLIRVRRLGSQLRPSRSRSSIKVLPEPNEHITGGGRVEAISSGSTWRNQFGRLRLWGTSEDKDLKLVFEQLEHHGYTCKRDFSLSAELPIRSPKTSRPARSKPSKSSRIQADAETHWNSATVGVPTMITVC